MTTLVKYQAVTKIGIVKAVKGHAGMQARRVGEQFTLDISDPFQKSIRDRLYRFGAILPINEPDLPIVQGILDYDVGRAKEPAPTSTESVETVEEEPAVKSVELNVRPEVDIFSDPSVSVEPLPLDAPIGTLIDILTPEIVDTLKRAGVKTIRDLERREDNELRSINGIGGKRLTGLREAYNLLKAEELESEHGTVSND